MNELSGGIDSAFTRRGQAGTGLHIHSRDLGHGACVFAMSDGEHCGRAFARHTPTQKRCDRHCRTAHNFRTQAELRTRRDG